MKTGGFLVLCGLAGLAGCSFDTASLVDGGPDVPRDTGSDLAPDNALDTGISVDTGTPTMTGRWRLVSFETAARTDGGGVLNQSTTPSISGLASVTMHSMAYQTALIWAGTVGLKHESLACPPAMFRTLQFDGIGFTGTLNDPTLFTVNNPPPTATINLSLTGNTARVNLRTDGDAGAAVATFERFSFPPPVRSYVNLNGQAVFGDILCLTPLASRVTRPHLVLLREVPGRGVGRVIGTPTALRLGLGSAPFRVSASGDPPADTQWMAPGGAVSIVYFVVFADLDGNGRFDHRWSEDFADGGTDAGMDEVWGISNMVLVWRPTPLTPLTAEDTSSFIDTYSGYQIAAIGPDFRSLSSASVPWLMLSGSPVPIGLFPEDPMNHVNPAVAVQATPITFDMPRLLR